MTAALPKSQQMMFEVLTLRTFLPGSPAGPMPCALPDGQTPDQSGPDLVHASRLAALEKDFERLTKDTCGLTSETSSRSAAQQLALASRLRARLDVNGSPECVLTWKEWPMLAGPPICALRASRRRTSGNDSTGSLWRTPSHGDGKRGAHPNPDAKAGEHSLTTQVTKSGWASPSAHDGRRPGTDIHSTQGGNLSWDAVVLTIWPTPRSEDSEQTGSHHGNLDTLNSASKAATPWATPSARDWRDGRASQETMDKNARPLNEQAVWNMPHCPRQNDSDNSKSTYLERQTFGLIPTGSNAQTGKPGAFQLNPAFSLWLQGFPIEWSNCADRAMQSFHPLRRRSSKL